MSNEDEIFIKWMEGQFDKEETEELGSAERSILELLPVGANILFSRPRNAIESIYRGEKLKEAATALFWYSYHFSKRINLDVYRTGLEKLRANRGANWSNKDDETSRWYWIGSRTAGYSMRCAKNSRLLR